MKHPSHSPAPARDRGFIAIVTLVAANAVWLLMMPWVPGIARCTLDRFHLRTGSFAAWAIQCPIPSMYNFANRYEAREFPPGLVDPIIDTVEPRYVNHFPARVFTFADGRWRLQKDGRDRWVTIESSYRGQTIQSRFHLKPGRRFTTFATRQPSAQR